MEDTYMKATKKLVLAAVSLAAAASLTVGSTFAWFSYQSSVSLEAVNFSVDSSDENLQVAVVTVGGSPAYSDFSYVLKEDTLKKAIKAANGGNDIAYAPLTVKEEDTASHTVKETNEIELYEKDETTAAPGGSYATFDLVFRYTPYKTAAGTPSTDMPNLVLNYGSQITTTTTTTSPEATLYAWDNFAESVYGIALNQDDPIQARAKDAARIAFVYTDSYATGTPKKNKVWAPSEGRDNGIAQSATSDTVQGFYKGNLASDYNIRHGAEGAVAVVAPTYESRVYAGIQSPSTANDFTYSSIAKFPAVQSGNSYSELRLTVKVWLEGKDGDCIESVREDDFAFTLKFRTSTVPVSGS